MTAFRFHLNPKAVIDLLYPNVLKKRIDFNLILKLRQFCF